MIPTRNAAAILSLAATLVGQATEPRIRADRVREVLTFLASDELGGRDSPSPGLDRAASWLAERFAEIGLERVTGPDFFHRYSLRGTALDPATLRVSFVRDGERSELVVGSDVRLWSSGRPFRGEDVACRVRRTGDGPFVDRGRSEQPTLIECSTDAPVWLAAEGARRVLSRRVPGGAPVLLVREGILRPGDEVALSLDVPGPEQVDVPLVNVVGLLPGGARKDEFVVVSAHCDHIGLTLGAADPVFNGADDNATGTTAVVVLAEALARRATPPSRSILFVCFSAEEKGLRGSRAFVADPPVALDQIVAVVNLEMLGRPEPDKRRQAWVTGRKLSDFEAIAGEAFARTGIACVEFASESMLFGASDNLPFASVGIVAHSISAGTLHADYHRPGDSADKIDFEHMTAIVDGLYDVVVAFAEREARPSYNEAGRARLGLDK
jgi:hypothetical protein